MTLLVLEYIVCEETLQRKVFFVSTLVHHAALMPYDSHCYCRVNFFDLAGIPSKLAEPEPFNIFDSIDAFRIETDLPLNDSFWDAPDTLYPWNPYWTDTGRQQEVYGTTMQSLLTIGLDTKPCMWIGKIRKYVIMSTTAEEPIRPSAEEQPLYDQSFKPCTVGEFVPILYDPYFSISSHTADA